MRGEARNMDLNKHRRALRSGWATRRQTERHVQKRGELFEKAAKQKKSSKCRHTNALYVCLRCVHAYEKGHERERYMKQCTCQDTEDS